jgi:hypothetical protein
MDVTLKQNCETLPFYSNGSRSETWNEMKHNPSQSNENSELESREG